MPGGGSGGGEASVTEREEWEVAGWGRGGRWRKVTREPLAL